MFTLCYNKVSYIILKLVYLKRLITLYDSMSHIKKRLPIGYDDNFGVKTC